MLAMVIVPLMQNHLPVSSLETLIKSLTVTLVTVMLGSLTHSCSGYNGLVHAWGGWIILFRVRSGRQIWSTGSARKPLGRLFSTNRCWCMGQLALPFCNKVVLLGICRLFDPCCWVCLGQMCTMIGC